MADELIEITGEKGMVFHHEKNVDIMNDIIDMSYYHKHTELTDHQTHVEVKNVSSKWIVIFSYYTDFEYLYKGGNANGAYYANFIKAGKKEGFEIPEIPNASKYDKIKGEEWYFNSKFDNATIPCYAYDLNSAYANILSNEIPDVRMDLGPGLIEEGQVGFNWIKGDIQVVFDKGKPATIRYKLIKSPWEKWAKSQYGRIVGFKKQGKKEEAKKIKASINIAIGCIKNHNFYLWKYIISASMRRMRSLIDENTIKINTDCIYSIVPRNDLDIGTGLGQFKADEKNGQIMKNKRARHIWGEETKMSGIVKPLQKTYDLDTETQIRQKDYILQGARLCQNPIIQK